MLTSPDLIGCRSRVELCRLCLVGVILCGVVATFLVKLTSFLGDLRSGVHRARVGSVT